MTGTQKIGIGALVLVVLGYAVYAQSKKDQQLGVVKKDAADLPTISTSEELDKIVISNADKGEVVLEKKGDKWALSKPVVFPANEQKVKSLLDNLKELKATEVIEANPSDDIKKSYQLDKDHAVHIQGYKGADKKVDDTFGKSGGRGQLMMTGDKPSIYASTGYSSYLYAQEVKAWRDGEILKFDEANVVSFAIEKSPELAASTGADAGAAAAKKSAGTLSFTKGDKWVGTWNGQAIPRFDEEKVKDALRIFHSLNADDFGDGKSLDETGLAKPQATVTIALKDNVGKYVLKVGKPANGTARYATKDGSETIYVIPSAAADWVTSDATKFAQAADAGAPKAPPSMPAGMPGMPPGMQGMPPGDPHQH